MSCETGDDTNRQKIKDAMKIVKLAVGEGVCYEAHIRLARKFGAEQLKDILFLLESFTEKEIKSESGRLIPVDKV